MGTSRSIAQIVSALASAQGVSLLYAVDGTPTAAAPDMVCVHNMEKSISFLSLLEKEAIATGLCITWGHAAVEMCGLTDGCCSVVSLTHRGCLKQIWVV